MEKKILSRQYLETLSTADLISISEDYGIDVPDNLNRTFIIGELLATEEELSQEKSKDDVILTDKDVSIQDELPETYNDTTVGLILRNPAWIFVYWDIKETDLNFLRKNPQFDSLFLHIAFFENEEDETSSDSFDVKVNFDERQQYILIPSNKKIVMADLVYSLKGENPKVMAFSRKVHIPAENPEITNIQPGKEIIMTDLERLSGMKELLYTHYNNYRQSFSI
ncbi:MAG: DUF4912 domain-containing protein [Spirochaetales bacterium]|nr:DUF4912 domain-containing protein [Spirochaetales bacterium]